MVVVLPVFVMTQIQEVVSGEFNVANSLFLFDQERKTTMNSIWEAESEVDTTQYKPSFSSKKRIHISLNVSNLRQSAAFYSVFFAEKPSKVREGYVKFEPVSVPLNFTLNEFPETAFNTIGHYGLQVKSTKVVNDTWHRLQASDFKIIDENDTECCYAEQTKIWVADPDGNRWEVFVTTTNDADNGCGSDCICYQEFERTVLEVS